MTNGQHFIKPPRHVETDRAWVHRLVGIDFLLRQPAAFGAGEFEFVAVILRWMGGQNGADGGQGYFPDAGQVIDYLLVFKIQLFAVLNMLPFAATTRTKMFAKRFSSQRRPVENPFRNRFPILLFAVRNAQIDHVAGSHTRSSGWIFNKNYALIGAHKALSLGGYGINSDACQPFGGFMNLPTHKS